MEINFTYVRYSATKLADKLATIGAKASDSTVMRRRSIWVVWQPKDNRDLATKCWEDRGLIGKADDNEVGVSRRVCCLPFLVCSQLALRHDLSQPDTYHLDVEDTTRKIVSRKQSTKEGRKEIRVILDEIL